MNFIDELLKEAEEAEQDRRIQVDRMRADHILMALEVLDGKLADVRQLADEEIALIDQYRKSEEDRLQKRIGWLSVNLEQFMRTTGEKTLHLPHGDLKLRTGRMKVEVVDMDAFLKTPENQSFLRVIPETFQPNLVAIHDHIKATGEIPAGTDTIPAEVKFSYSLIRRSKSHVNSTSEDRVTIESAHKSQAIEGAAV